MAGEPSASPLLLRCLGGVLALGVAMAAFGEVDFALTGHLKGRALIDDYPDDSVFRAVAGRTGVSGESELRLQLDFSGGGVAVDVDYQLFAIAGDNLRISDELALGGNPATAGVLNDDRRWFDLTHVIHDGVDGDLIQRLDRLAISWTGERAVIRFGRQALSWGGGLFFAPFDIVNPFDPATIDTEFKTGDDMLYAQWLRDSGDDIQFAWVHRRDPLGGDLSTDEGTVAAKYHRVDGEREYDLLLAENRDRATLGIGLGTGLGGAVLRADVVVADAATGWRTEFLANASYSWIWSDHNVSGALEYYFNGWGIDGGGYSVADLLAAPELSQRLARGETFTIGRHYLAAGITVEVTPLWQLAPNVFANLDDPSALLQIVSTHSLSDNLTVLAALNLPLGPPGSEFGGIEALQPPDTYFSRSGGLFVQLAWYF